MKTRLKPLQLAETFRRQHIEIDAADRPFLNWIGGSGADEAGGQFADIRLVTDERDARLARVPASLLHDGGGCSGRSQRVAGDHLRLAAQRLCNNLGGLLGSDERAGDDDVERHVEGVQRFRRPAQLDMPLPVSGRFESSG